MHNIISYSSLENNANSSVSAEREQTNIYGQFEKEKKQTVACCFTKILRCEQASKNTQSSSKFGQGDLGSMIKQ